ncbi:hypothetical protein ACRRTK_022520 [Alexandromys fortis]
MNGGFQSHLSEGQGDLDKVVEEEIAEMRDTKIQDTSWSCTDVLCCMIFILFVVGYILLGLLGNWKRDCFSKPVYSSPANNMGLQIRLHVPYYLLHCVCKLLVLKRHKRDVAVLFRAY